MSFSLITTIIGIIVGVLLFFVNLKLRKTLLGSFFKKSYMSALVGCFFLSLSFIAELLELLGYQEGIFDPVHHVFILISSFAFFSVALIFPKETEAALASKK